MPFNMECNVLFKLLILSFKLTFVSDLIIEIGQIYCQVNFFLVKGSGESGVIWDVFCFS